MTGDDFGEVFSGDRLGRFIRIDPNGLLHLVWEGQNVSKPVGLLLTLHFDEWHSEEFPEFVGKNDSLVLTAAHSASSTFLDQRRALPMVVLDIGDLSIS